MMASAETDPPPSGGGEDGDFPIGLPGTAIPDFQPTFPPNGTGGAHRLW
jgi:hypothetical protein